MELYRYLKEETVRLDLQATARDQAIDELAEVLRDHPSMEDFDKFLQDVHQREKAGTTGIGQEVAIPHARTNSVNDFVVAVGASKNGIEFEAIDGNPVRLVILMGIPAVKVNEYLKLLAHMSLLMKQKDFVDSIVKAEDSKSIIDCFTRHEQ